MAVLGLCWAFLVAQIVKNLPAMHKTWVLSFGWEDPLEKGMSPTPVFLGFPGNSAGKESACNVRNLGSIPGLGIRKRLLSPVVWPGEFHGLYSP